MIAIGLVTAALAGAPATGQPLKTCPDNSVVRATDRCMELPDHRTQFANQPKASVHSVEWRCGGQAALARLRVSALPALNDGAPVSNGESNVEVLTVTVNGLPASARTILALRTGVAGWKRLSVLDGRCFADDTPALMAQGFDDRRGPEQRTVQVELR